jgi:hypothetical protein
MLFVTFALIILAPYLKIDNTQLGVSESGWIKFWYYRNFTFKNQSFWFIPYVGNYNSICTSGSSSSLTKQVCKEIYRMQLSGILVTFQLNVIDLVFPSSGLPDEHSGNDLHT